MQKMKYLKRTVTCMLAVFMLLLYCGCTSDKIGEGDTTVPETEPALSLTLKQALADYTIIYPDVATNVEKTVMQELLKAFDDPTMRPRTDFVKRNESIPSNNNEILIGKTNRVSSQQALAELENPRDYTVRFYEGEVVIVGKSDDALTSAMYYFIEKMLLSDASLYEAGYSYDYEHVYSMSSFFGLSLSGLRISYAESDTLIYANLLKSYIKDNTGKEPVVAKGTDGNVKLVVDDTLEDDAYAVDVSSGKVTVRGGTKVALCEAVKAIISGNKGGDTLSFTGKSTIPLSITSPRDNDTMYLVWNDEFDGDSLNKGYWNLYDRMFGTSKMMTTTNDRNIKVQNGNVVMNAYKESDNTYSTHKTLTTWDRMSFRYGYLEIYAKVPYHTGAFPGFWLQSAYQHRSVDYMTEIDIFEVYSKDYIEAAMHKWYLGESGSAEAHDWHEPTGYRFSDTSGLSDEYHLYGFGWTPTEVYFAVDGEVFGSFDITESGDFGQGATLTGMDGFQDPVIINFTNWLCVDSGSLKDSNHRVHSNSEFPFTFSVDWIRLYQKAGEGDIYYDKPTATATLSAQADVASPNTLNSLLCTMTDIQNMQVSKKRGDLL